MGRSGGWQSPALWPEPAPQQRLPSQLGARSPAELRALPTAWAPPNLPRPPSEGILSTTAAFPALLSLRCSPRPELGRCHDPRLAVRGAKLRGNLVHLPKPPLPEPCDYGDFCFLFFALICSLCGRGVLLHPGAAGPGEGEEGNHPAKEQTPRQGSADTEHPSLDPLCKQDPPHTSQKSIFCGVGPPMPSPTCLSGELGSR